MKLKLGMFIIMAIIVMSACSDHEIIQKNTKASGNPELDNTITSYFMNFNDIQNFSQYATDDFIKRVYAWCSGDYSDEKSLNEMKEIYLELIKSKLQLAAFEIEEVSIKSEKDAEIKVTRTWENGEKDQTSYSIIKDRGIWKVDNRF
jgi:hypothetical protein